ncbi:hypothetical protein VV867_09145 [Pseudomonas sp. JH-2]|uniref:hypothetical protein n=1 Tax=Pseudomonas sp. JH-2 TaxID=3114998 RepID=UPI002E2752EF|nr:hypothetical protein [Pseudomonas sp. JH-2]
MTEQQACALCGAEGHTAAQCHWNGPGALESIRLPKHGTTIALEEMLAGYPPDDREYVRDVIEAYADIQARKAVMLYSGAGRQSDACDWLENLEGDAWADACEEIATSVQKHTEQAEGAQGERERFEAWWNDPAQWELRKSCAMGWGEKIWRAAQGALAGQVPEWSSAKPTVEGAYWVRGNGLNEPAVILVKLDQGELWCNLHMNNTETDFGYGYTIAQLSSEFEWFGPLAAAPQPAGGEA